MTRKFQPLERAGASISNPWKSILLAGLLAGSAAAQTYEIRDLGTLGGANSRAYDINAAGWVVGEAETSSGFLHAFLWTPTNGMTDLGTLGGDLSRAYSLNDRGVVVGEAEDADGRMLAFHWKATDGMTSLPLPEGMVESYAYGNNNYGMMAGAGDLGEGTRALVWSVNGPSIPAALSNHGSSIAHDVNDFGDLVGQAESGGDGAWVGRAFFLGSAGLHRSMGPVTGEWSSAALAINAEGMGAGFAEQAGATHAVLLHPTNGWIDIDTLDSVYSVAYGINGTGQAVGLFVTSHEDEDRAFLYDGQHMLDLNERVESEEPWLLVEARAINDAGQIVGYGLRHTRDRAFLLTPRPGPGPESARVNIVQPTRGSRFLEGGAATLQVDVEGMPALHRVTYFANGTVLGSVTSAPFAFTWKSLDAGSYDLIAAASDRQGRIRRSPRVRMEVDFQPRAEPVIVVIEPDDGTALAAGSNLLIHAEAQVEDGEPSAVTLQMDGSNIFTEAGSTATFLWTAPTTGMFTVTAVAENEDGLMSTSAPVRVNVSDPEPAPKE